MTSVSSVKSNPTLPPEGPLPSSLIISESGKQYTIQRVLGNGGEGIVFAVCPEDDQIH